MDTQKRRPDWRLLLTVTAWVLALSLAVPSAFAQEVLVSRFKPDLPVYPQFFSVVQGADGTIYLGHDQQVLRFDGNRWSAIALPTVGPVRELAMGRDGRIWVGASNSFGYLSRDETGADRFVDLTPTFEKALGQETFSDIWRMLVTGDAVYFAALNHLFAVSADGEPLGLWRHPGRFGALSEVGGSVYVQWRGEGLKRLGTDGTFHMVPDGERFAAPMIRNLIPLAGDQALLHTRSPELMLWSERGTRALNVTDDAPLELLTGGRAVDANTVVFGGSDGTVRVLDVDRGTFEQAPVSGSFLSDVAFSHDGAVLVAGNEGVLRLPWPASWVKYARTTGLRGSVHDLVMAGQHLYAMTGAGVYRASLDGSKITGPFTRQNWSTGEAWGLLPTEDGLLLATSHDLKLIRDGEPARLGPDNLYPRHLLIDDDSPDVLWTGNEHGLAVFEKRDGRWELVDRAETLGMRITSLVRAGGDTLWAGTEAHGLKRASLDRTEGLKIQLSSVGPDSGLVVGEDGFVVVSESSVGALVSTSRGTYRFDGVRFLADDLGGLSDLKPANEVLSFFDGPNGSIWGYNYRALYSRRAGFWTVTDLSGLDSGAIDAVTLAADNSLWIGGASEVFHYKPEVSTAPGSAALSLAELVRVDSKDGDNQALPLAGELSLAGNRASVEARFRLSDLDQAASTVYRSRLLGQSERWSSWSGRGEVSYAGLTAGTYTLEAEARTGTGRIYTLEPRVFSVVPRWFEAIWARSLALLFVTALLLVAVTAMQRRQVARLAAQNRALDETVKVRTRELEVANRQLRDQAERDALTGVGNRRLFDQKMCEVFDEVMEYGTSMALLLVDVDHFKRYNDAHGHQAGDWLLSKLARVLANNVRDDTVVARYGGEEFAVVVPRCDNLSAARLARRLVRQVSEELDDVTVSIGVAGYAAERDESPDDLISRADQALYSAKNQGRNRYVLAA
ncbi:MAG: diguanylate cyclase [Pseudomonadota bacterium]